MLRSSVALVGLVLVGCGPAPIPPATSLAPQAYAAPAYYRPAPVLPYQGIDGSMFMNRHEPPPMSAMTCYTIGTNLNCRTY